MQKTQTVKDKEVLTRPLGFEDDWLVSTAVFKKWRITAKKIWEDKLCLVPSANAVFVQKDAAREANEKARLELKPSTSDFCTSEQFDHFDTSAWRVKRKSWRKLS